MTDPVQNGQNDQPRAYCGAKTRNGGTCKSAPIQGATRCRMHGGASPRAKAAAERRLAEQAAREAVVTYGLPVDISPTEALLREVRYTAGHVEWLRARVQELEEAKLTVGVTEQKIDPTGAKSTKIESVPNAWVRLYQEERRHLVAVTTAALKAGVEERRVRLEEAQGAAIVELLDTILDGLDLTPAQQEKAHDVVPRALRAIEGGAA